MTDNSEGHIIVSEPVTESSPTAHIRAMTKKQDLPDGTRVTITLESIEHHQTLSGHSGTVIGQSDYAGCVRVKWDHQKSAKTIRVELLKSGIAHRLRPASFCCQSLG